MLILRHLCGFLSCLFFILTFSVVLTEVNIQNFVVSGHLPDGENKFMRFGDIIVREASISETSVNRKYKLTLMLRQVATGPNFLQLIYKDIDNRNRGKKTRLVECEAIDDWKSANEFRNKFQRQLERAGIHISPTISQQNSHADTVQDEEGDDDNLSNVELDNWDLEFDPEAIEPLHKETIDLTQGLTELQNVTVRMLRDDEIVDDLRLAFDVKLQQKHCRRLHRRLRRGIQQQQLQKLSSTSDTGKISRVRRSEFPIGIVPGTLWCGFGNANPNLDSSSIGAHVGTDVCCRQHDHCPVILPALTTQFGVFNYRMNTISHCTCDENRSKRELSMNQLTETFRFPGKCLKMEYKKQAHLRDPTPY